MWKCFLKFYCNVLCKKISIKVFTLHAPQSLLFLINFWSLVMWECSCMPYYSNSSSVVRKCQESHLPFVNQHNTDTSIQVKRDQQRAKKHTLKISKAWALAWTMTYPAFYSHQSLPKNIVVSKYLPRHFSEISCHGVKPHASTQRLIIVGKKLTPYNYANFWSHPWLYCWIPLHWLSKLRIGGLNSGR